MSIVTFFNNGKEQTGKTLSVVAIATQMAIEHNYKILIVSTGHNDKTLDNCFWKPKKKKLNLGLFGPNASIATEDGVESAARAMKSKRLTPENIINYTKAIFKDRLEILQSSKGNSREYEEIVETYPDIINLANKNYDLVFVDLDLSVPKQIREQILQNSNLVVINLSQRLTSIDKYMEDKANGTELKFKKSLLLINRYDKYSKYSIKNITRYMKEKNDVSTIPYNTLFFEACEEAKVPDFFLKIRNVGEDDRNAFFLSEVKRAGENIIYRLKDLSMKL